MKKCAAALRRRLRDRRGESIAEVLVALLISAVSLLMLASLIATSTRLVRSSEALMETYYAANDELTKSMAGSGPAVTDGGEEDGAALEVLSGTLEFTYSADGETDPTTVPLETGNIKYAENSEVSGEKKTVVAFWKQSS